MNFRLLGVLVVAACFGCGKPPPSRSSGDPKPKEATLATASAREVEPPLLDLRTGALTPEHEATPLELEPVARHAGPEFETLRFRFQGTRRARLDWNASVEVPGATFAFVADSPDLKGGVLWIRRSIAKANEPVSGTLFASAQGAPGIRFDLRTKSGAAMPASKPEVEVEWQRALAGNARGDSFSGDPFTAFMRRRLIEMAAKKQPLRGVSRVAPNLRAASNATELSRLMETTTGRAQIQQALQASDTLALDLAREPKRLPLAAAKPPELPRADYEAMLGALGRSAPAEPLAAVAPADFWYLRSRSFTAFLDLLELSETFGQPAADLLGGRSENRGTTARYTAEVALERTELARVLGPSVVESVAVMGSDPYVHDGTDVTLVFKVTTPSLFDVSLAKALANHASAHGGVTKSELVHEGVTIRIARSANGRVRQHRATVAGFELVSNSPAAIRRVISTALGKAPRLADEKDFQYLLARDAGTPDETLAFLSDRFVLSVIGPAQKIAQARRQLALAELTTPGFAALLFGWTHGRSPKDAAELLKSGELLAKELKHEGGAPIAWQPGKPAASHWGTTIALEPLIDLPAVKTISVAEQRAYADFSSRYAFLWSEYVDPVIVRFARSSDESERYDVHIRALPLLRSDNRELLQMVGAAMVDVPALDSGLRWVLALGKDAALRHALDGYAQFGGHSLKFDWLGDSVTLGIADRAELTSVARPFVARQLEPPNEDRQGPNELEALAGLPLYASVEVKNRLGAVVALGVLRKLAEEVARDAIRWRDGGKHREIAITDVAIARSVMLRGGHVYYALCPKALIFALNRAVLERLIDDELDGKSPRGATETRRSHDGQFVVELGAKKEGALLRVIGWLATAELVERTASRQSAEAVLRGAPESRASADAFETFARATLGHVPLTPDGNLYQYSPEGIRDPVRGTPYAPIFPATPVAGSPLASLLARFARIRTSIAFDTEHGARANGVEMQSFSAKVSLELR